MCLFPEENQQPVLGSHRFSEEKWHFSLDVKQKHTFYRRKSTKKIAKVSRPNNNYSFRIISPFNNNNNNKAVYPKLAPARVFGDVSKDGPQRAAAHGCSRHSELREAEEGAAAACSVAS